VFTRALTLAGRGTPHQRKVMRRLCMRDTSSSSKPIYKPPSPCVGKGGDQPPRPAAPYRPTAAAATSAATTAWKQAPPPSYTPWLQLLAGVTQQGIAAHHNTTHADLALDHMQKPAWEPVLKHGGCSTKALPRLVHILGPGTMQQDCCNTRRQGTGLPGAQGRRTFTGLRLPAPTTSDAHHTRNTQLV
jgi:hypothetical protein